MTLYHQKSSKPGRRTSTPPKKKHPWKAGLTRRKMILKNAEVEETSAYNYVPEIMNIIGGS